MRVKRVKFNTVLCVFFLLFCFLLIAVHFLFYGLARYRTNTDVTANAKVGKYVFDVSSGAGESFYIDLSDIKKAGDSTDAVFTVTNKSGQSISDVIQKYRITITKYGSMPLTYSLKKDGKALTLTGGVSDWLEIGHTTEESHMLTLTVTWPTDKTDYKLTEEIDLFQVYIESEQKY